MKRILMSVFTIFAVTAVVANGTSAVFFDTQTVSGNTFSAGTLELTVDGTEGASVQPFTSSNLQPGESSGRRVFTLKNTGSIDAKPKICLKNLESSGPSAGDIADELTLVTDTNGAWLMTAGHPLNDFEDRCWTPDDPADAEFGVQGTDVLAPGEEMSFGVKLDLPSSAGNDVQGNSASFDLEFTLEQI